MAIQNIPTLTHVTNSEVNSSFDLKDSSQTNKISQIASKSLKSNWIVSSWRWIAVHLRNFFRCLVIKIHYFFVHIILRRPIPTYKTSPSKQLDSLPQNTETLNIVKNIHKHGDEIINEIDKVFSVHKIHTELLTEDASKIDLSNGDAKTAQHLFALCHEFDEYYELINELHIQVDQKSSIENALEKLIQSLTKSKESLHLNIKNHKSVIEMILKRQLEAIGNKIEGSSPLVYHEKLFIKLLTKESGVLSGICSAELVQSAKEMKKKYPETADPCCLNLGSAAPVSFENIGNSCYMNSTLQAMLSSPYFLGLCNQNPLREPRETNEDFIKRQNVHFKMRQLVEAIHRPDEKLFFGLSKNYVNNALYQLRDAICQSGLNGDINQSTTNAQQDAAVLALLLCDVLEAKYVMREWRTVSFEGKDLNTSPVSEFKSLFSVEFKDDSRNLQEMINNSLCDRVNDADGYRPEIDGKQIQVQSYVTHRKFKEVPEAFFLQVKRQKFSDNSEKITTDLEIPDDNILNFSSAVESVDCRFRIKGYVIHQGDSLDSGHYVSYVQRGVQWYYCSDSTVILINEVDIPKSQAYLFLLEYIN